MERDGSQRSVWQDSATIHKREWDVDDGKNYDVAIVGGGITGISLALMLQESGVSCILLEGHTIGFGTTGGTTAHVNTFLDEPYTSIQKNFSVEGARLVARAVQDALNLIGGNVSTYDIRCGWQMHPGFVHARTEEQEADLSSIVQCCRELGVLCGFTDTTGLDMRRFRTAARFPGQYSFHPLRYVNALAERFEKKGGVIAEHCPVERTEHNGACTLHTPKGVIRSSKLVYATHIPPGVNILHTLNAPYRSYVIAASLDHRGELPEGLNYDMEEPYHYYRCYMDGGEPLVIVGGEDHKTGHSETQPQAFRALEAHTRERFPVMEVKYQWSSQFYQPADGLAYIGLMPGHDEDVYVATGFGGNGMVYGPMAAMILHDMITSGGSAYSEVFSPSRFKPIASGPDLLKENTAVVKDLVLGRLSREKLEVLAELAPGEGRVVLYEGRKMGVYKDDNGQVFALSAVCPHMNCEVKWNSVEKSWDCPCHGSRFSFTGEVLTGPATESLVVIR